MILLKSRDEIERMRAASGIVAEILLAVRERVRPGQMVDPRPIGAEAPAAEAPPTMPKRTSAPTVAKPQPGLGTASATERRS